LVLFERNCQVAQGIAHPALVMNVFALDWLARRFHLGSRGVALCAPRNFFRFAVEGGIFVCVVSGFHGQIQTAKGLKRSKPRHKHGAMRVMCPLLTMKPAQKLPEFTRQRPS
jgi:hypothetical protein